MHHFDYLSFHFNHEKTYSLFCVQCQIEQKNISGDCVLLFQIFLFLDIDLIYHSLFSYLTILEIYRIYSLMVRI